MGKVDGCPHHPVLSKIQGEMSRGVPKDIPRVFTPPSHVHFQRVNVELQGKKYTGDGCSLPSHAKI